MIIAAGPIDIPYGSHLVCPRCSFRLRSPKKDTVNRTLALSLTGLILYLPAHFTILLTFEALGMADHGSIFTSIMELYKQKYGFVAFIVLLTAQIFPLLKLGLLFCISLGISRRMFVPLLPRLLRWFRHLQEWGMSEVYLIGILVTIIKMTGTTRISYETGFICFVGLVVVMTCISLAFDKGEFWVRIEQLLLERQKADNRPGERMLFSSADVGRTAISAGLAQCHVCHKVIPYREPQRGHSLVCPRCGGRVHSRIPQSVSTTWALVIAAILLSLPANLLPIMQVDFLGVPDLSTIMDGIIYFFQDGSYGIGMIILTASILVPVFKILGLMVLLYSIHMQRPSRLKQKSIMFRFIEFIGRWSMLDIFVIALLSALVNFGFFTTIKAAPAAFFFTCVVLSTMFAAISFDPRLLWDVIEPSSLQHQE